MTIMSMTRMSLTLAFFLNSALEHFGSNVELKVKIELYLNTSLHWSTFLGKWKSLTMKGMWRYQAL